MKHPVHRWLGSSAFTNAGNTWRQFSQLTTHFSLAGFGLRMRLIPNPRADERVPPLLLMLAAVLIWFIPDPLFRAGVLWIALSPVWFYAACAIPNIALENRFYIALPGMGMLAAWAWERGAHVGVLLLIVAYLLRSNERATHYLGEIGFWHKAACEESTMLAWFNYASHLERYLKTPEAKAKLNPVEREFKLRKVVNTYWMIAERWPNDPNRTPATAANLCAALLHKAKVMREIHGVDSPLVQAAQNEAFSVLDEAYVRWPDSPEVRSQRGWLFHQLGGLEDAIKEYSALIHLQTNNADALRRRAQLYAQLRRNDEAIADFKAAERIDGIKANITFERAQPEEEYSHA